MERQRGYQVNTAPQYFRRDDSGWRRARETSHWPWMTIPLHDHVETQDQRDRSFKSHQVHGGCVPQHEPYGDLNGSTRHTDSNQHIPQWIPTIDIKAHNVS